MTTTLPATFDGETLTVGAPIASPALSVRASCPHGQSVSRLTVDYDDTGHIVHIVATGFGTDHRSRIDGYDWETEVARTLWSDAREGVLRFTDDPGMYKWEPGEMRPEGIEPWNGVAVDLTGGLPVGPEWDDFYPVSDCTGCIEDDSTPRFGLCISMDGKVNGLFIEGAVADLPQPPDADVRVRGSGVWPD